MPESNKAIKENPPINWAPTLIFSLTFLVAVTAVPVYGIMVGYDAVEWTVFTLMLAFCGLSITGGYHRLWSHRAYDANPVVRAFFAFWGACALQNTILIWCSGHRKHHRYVDDVDHDPYSINRGLWFAHIGWMLRNYKSGEVDLNNTQDLQRDNIVMFQHKYYVPLVVLSNVGVPLLLGYLNGNILGMLLLAGVLRLVISHHVTFFINSLCHAWGKQPYTNTNTAKDNFMLALFTYGEGYHNFHHYFQTDYRNGVRWWQFDPTKWMISCLSWLGLASNQSGRNSNYSTSQGRVLTADELMRLPPDEQILQVDGVGFIHCRKFYQNQFAPYCFELAPNPLEGGRLPPDPRVVIAGDA